MTNLFETWSLDREIVLVKLLNHPRDKVFAAWMDPKALAQWYGPAGLSIENHEADIREGGVWRFDMVGVFEGQEQRFPNLMRFLSLASVRWNTGCRRWTASPPGWMVEPLGRSMPRGAWRAPLPTCHDHQFARHSGRRIGLSIFASSSGLAQGGKPAMRMVSMRRLRSASV
jgi:hypothetical protein